MTKVLLINPPCRHRVSYGEMGLYIPSGLLSIAAVVRDVCEVRIFDSQFTDCEHREFQGEFIVGSSFQRIRAEVEDFRPDVVGIPAAFSSNAGFTKIVGHLCREVSPEIVVVVGGPDASVRYSLFLEGGSCDLCVIGEGERSFRQIIDRVNRRLPLTGIGGTAWQQNDVVRHLPGEFISDLDSLPLPAYELIDLGAYLAHPRTYKGRGLIQQKALSLVTSRGCPYSCNFCSIHLHMGKKYRSQSPEYVLEHLDHLIGRYQVAHFHFEDDNLALNRSRFDRILDGLASKKITWEASNGIRVDSLNHALLKRMKAAGFSSAHLPIESGNQRTLTEIIRKNLSLEKIEEVVKAAHALEMHFSAFYIIGFPGETMDEMERTLDLSVRYQKDYNVTPILLYANPLKGTRLYDQCLEQGLIDSSLGDADFPPPTPAVLHEDPVFIPQGVSKDDLQGMLDRYRSTTRNESLLCRARSFIHYHLRPSIRERGAATWALLTGRGRVNARRASKGDAALEGTTFAVKYSRSGREHGAAVGVGMKLSRDGFLLLTNDRLDEHDRLTVCFDSADRAEPAWSAAEVASVNRVRSFPSYYCFEAAIKFTREPGRSGASTRPGLPAGKGRSGQAF